MGVWAHAVPGDAVHLRKAPGAGMLARGVLRPASTAPPAPAPLSADLLGAASPLAADCRSRVRRWESGCRARDWEAAAGCPKLSPAELAAESRGDDGAESRRFIADAAEAGCAPKALLALTAAESTLSAALPWRLPRAALSPLGGETELGAPLPARRRIRAALASGLRCSSLRSAANCGSSRCLRLQHCGHQLHRAVSAGRRIHQGVPIQMKHAADFIARLLID